jgi:hypothetical protein
VHAVLSTSGAPGCEPVRALHAARRLSGRFFEPRQPGRRAGKPGNGVRRGSGGGVLRLSSWRQHGYRTANCPALALRFARPPISHMRFVSHANRTARLSTVGPETPSWGAIESHANRLSPDFEVSERLSSRYPGQRDQESTRIGYRPEYRPGRLNRPTYRPTRGNRAPLACSGSDISTDESTIDVFIDVSTFYRRAQFEHGSAPAPSWNTDVPTLNRRTPEIGVRERRSGRRRRARAIWAACLCSPIPPFRVRDSIRVTIAYGSKTGSARECRAYGIGLC